MNGKYLCIITCALSLAGGWGNGALARERSGEGRPSPVVTVGTNAVYWATASLNAGLEVGLTPETSLEFSAACNPWTFRENRKFKFWLLQPEFRYRLCQRFCGHFLGVHFVYADFNAGGLKFLGMNERRYEGNLYGAGVAYGYLWPVGNRWSIEATVGLGYLRSDYDRYVWRRCGKFLGKGYKNYIGPTRIGVSVRFTIR